MRRFSTWFALILIGSALLLNGASSVSGSSEKHQNQTAAHERSGKDKSQIATPSFTIVVQPAPVQIIQPSAAVEQKKPAQKWYQRPTVTDWGILGVTLLYALISLGLLNATKTQATLAKESAETAACALKETQTVNRIAQRGYLYIANATVKRPSEDQIEIEYPVKNAGVTPATLLGISECFKVEQTLRGITPLTLETARFSDKRTVIPPNSEIGIGCSWTSPLDDEEVRKLNAESSIFFHGIVMYEDIFGQTRYLGFGLRTVRKLEVGTALGLGFIAEEGFNWFK
jgi:hypothetical protein